MISDATIDPQTARTALLALKNEVEQILGLVDSESRPVELDQNRVGRLSRMDALQGQAMAQASVERQHDLLRKIDLGLKRIASGDYGRCLTCDECIPSARLLADPTISHCVVCASALENR